MRVVYLPVQEFRRHSVGAFLLAFLMIVVVAAGTNTSHAEAAFVGRVSKVLDGDTFTLRGESRRIRIWGLDAPERNEAGGSFATATLRALISGERLQCVVLDVDRYGRLVAQCLLPSGHDIAAEMIRAGAAREFCRYSSGYYGTC